MTDDIDNKTSSWQIYLYTILSCVGIIGVVLMFWYILYLQVKKRKNAPIQIKSNTYFKAFALNATVISISLASTITINNILHINIKKWPFDNNLNTIITISVAFAGNTGTCSPSIVVYFIYFPCPLFLDFLGILLL